MGLGVFSISFAVVSLVTAIDPECQALIDANSQTLDLIRTIQVNYIIADIESRQVPIDEIWWSREGRRERIKRAGHKIAPTADGRPRGISDLLIDGDAFKWLQNWDPQNPQKIRPTNPGTVRADVSPRTGMNPAGLAPSEQLRFEIDSVPRRTLRELAKVSPTVSCKGKVQLDGRELWLISLESPEETTATTMKKHYDVYLDPAAGHLIRKIVVHSNALRPNGKIETYSRAHEVIDFKDFGDGVFVPARIRNGTLDSWLSELVVKSIKVNEPIPPETFEMKWPKFSLVRYHPAVNGELNFEVWGDGKPLRAFKGSDDLRPFEAELRKDPLMAAELGPEFDSAPPPPTSTLTKLFIAFVALLAVMIALVIRRRLREQREQGI